MDLTSLFERARAAGRELLQLPVERVDEILRAVADEALAQSEYILSENARDLERMSPDNPMYDRLKLTSARLEGIAADTRHVADLPSPLGRVLKHTVLPNGLDLKRVSVPFGVIGVIYEARPNVSFDVFSLCLKAGSACVLKGGSDADFSNRAIVKVIHVVLERFGVNPDHGGFVAGTRLCGFADSARQQCFDSICARECPYSGHRDRSRSLPCLF